MSTEPQKMPAPLPTGGQVMAVVPQSFEEIQRIANTIIAAGIAPQSLIKRVKDDASDEDHAQAARQNIASVATAIMAGAELGLPPFVALRSFTVINGRPALYADGNVAVVRKAKSADGKPVCEYIRNGYDIGDSDETTFAFCEAKRADTGEVHREEFSVADAKRARLWDDREEAEREVWEYVPAERKRKPFKRMLPNDAPWHRFPKRMMIWRATGYCLRWLFADVLGGMPDEYEARDIEGMIDITPMPPPTKPSKPVAPEPPSDDEIDAESTTIEGTTLRSGDTMTVEQTLTDEGTHFKVTTDRVTVTRAPEPPVDEEQSNYTAGDMPADTTDAAASDAEPGSEEWFGNLEYWSESAYDTEALESVFKDLNAHSLGQGTRQRERAQEIYDKHIARINRRNAEAAGQKSFLEDMPEETRQAVKNGNTP